MNGPGEAAYNDLGFTGGKDSGMLYVSGKPSAKISNAEMIDRIVEMVEAKAEEMRAARDASAEAAE